MFCICVRGGDREGAHRRARPAPRAGGDGPLRQRDADLLADHLAAGRAGHPGRRAARLLAVLRRLHHHELQLRRPSTRSRCSSGVSAQRGIPAQVNVIGVGDVLPGTDRWCCSGRPSRRGRSRRPDGADPGRGARRRPRTRRTGWTAPAPRSVPGRSPGPRRPTSLWSEAATPACGPRCWRRSATRAGDVVLLEARSVGWAASGRNGGFCAASLTHGVRNGLRPVPGRDGDPGTAGRGRTSTASRRPSPTTASTATSSAPAS